MVWANPRPLAATRGVSVDLLSSGYLDVSVPLVRLLRPMYSVKGYLGYPRWVSPFGHLWIKVWLPTPQSFSQAPTSFIASNCQGIHRMRLVAWPYKQTDSPSLYRQETAFQSHATCCVIDFSPDCYNTWENSVLFQLIYLVKEQLIVKTRNKNSQSTELFFLTS